MQPGLEAEFKAYYDRNRDEPVYVILGVQGSGTNLLGRLLVRIFNFSLMRDRSLVFNAAARLGRAPTPDAIAREIRTVTTHIFPSTLTRKTSKYAISDNDPFAGIERVLQPSAIRTGADLARLVYAYRAFSLGTTRMAIKSDDLWETIGAIDDVLPNRQIILITRDFRDNLLSIGGKNFGPVEPLCAAQYVKERIRRYAGEYRKFGDKAYHVKFTTLVDSPRAFVDDFARHFKLTPTVDPDAVISAFPFRQGKVGKWKSLPADQLAWCEGILRDELLEFGYPLASPSPRMPHSRHVIAASARDKLRRVPQKIRRLVERLSG
jgi:hypothetical protein